jgi:GTPase SAR1 family protein
MQQANEIKVGLIGYPKTGKTKFIEKLLYGDSSVNKPYKPTLGVDVKPYDFKDETHDNTVYEGWLSENTNFSYVDMNVENPIANIISDIKNKIIKPYSEL